MTIPPVFVDTPLPSPITEFVGQVFSANLEAQNHYASGTAVIVSPHLALTARHVLDDHWRLHGSEPMPSRDNHGQFNLFLGQLVGESLNLWSITKFWVSGDTDIALLRLHPFSESASNYKVKHLTLSVLPPRIGTQVHGFGYAESSAEKKGPKEIVIAHRPRSTHGAVIELFPDRRDPIKLPFPCFRTNARFDGGMSGGAIINDDGHLCGLICSSYPPFQDDEDHASYAVMLWPIMGMAIDMDRIGYPRDSRYVLFDLVKDKMLIVADADKLTVGELPASGGARVELFVPKERL